ncbi:hypothetical protein J2Z21_002945 [Streptomyces griseochromogenes]|uniref:SnoaL-like domain-containing protein n=1 Tax=Streptomyces griseochromogenes TaxID=68214 RepID=A0A1B1AXI3_9ACTN|nr:hypothetical protein [Streptomyces griseochromogenes]ANP51296.1 hypothetical protein AVL59_18200 [Streptomyces griseochromogenes]MBP2050009.1 hypothetical protein [Streptomyces griseochromogenes]
MSVRSRKTLLTAVALTAGLTLAAVTPALAGSGASRTTRAAVSSAEGDPRNVTQHVADFYGAYIDSVWATEDPSAAAGAKALRAFYLTAAAQKKVAAFEEKNHADGILFAQNVPVKWKVTYTGSGAGHATSRVTLTWGDGSTAQVSKIDVQSDLKTLKITDLKPAR